MTTRQFSPKAEEVRRRDVGTYGVVLASNDRWTGDGQVLTVHRDAVGTLFLLGHGGGVADLCLPLAPEKAAAIIQTLRATADGREWARALGLDVEHRDVETLSVPATVEVRDA